MSEPLRRAEAGVLGWIDRDFIGPMADFEDPAQEWRRLFSEFYGTFLLVLVAAGGGMMGQAFPNTISGQRQWSRRGLMVMGVIMFMGKVSGAHLNPAVSLAFSLRGDFPWRRVPGYIVVQLVGASLAALFLHEVIKVSAKYGSNYPASGYSNWQALLMEAALTMGLVSVILGTASGAQNIGIFGAIGVGAYIALAGLWGSPISGTSMNPARTLDPISSDATSPPTGSTSWARSWARPSRSPSPTSCAAQGAAIQAPPRPRGISAPNRKARPGLAVSGEMRRRFAIGCLDAGRPAGLNAELRVT